MWQPPSAGTVATHLGVGQRFLPGQAAQGPMVAPAAWQLDVWSLRSQKNTNMLDGLLGCDEHWQGRASTGQLPFLLLYRPQSASDHQLLVHHMPGCSHSH